MSTASWASVPALNWAGTWAGTTTREAPGFFDVADAYRHGDGYPTANRGCFLVEWYQPDLIGGDLATAVARLDACAASMSVQGAPVRVLMTLAVPGDQVVFSVFAAGSADPVAQACQRAAMPPRRLSAAVHARIPSQD